MMKVICPRMNKRLNHQYAKSIHHNGTFVKNFSKGIFFSLLLIRMLMMNKIDIQFVIHIYYALFS